MAVCSFLGHRHIYGHDVQLRLQAAVNHLVEENDSVEFLLYLWKSTEPFYALCLLAALRAKQCAPQKVTLTLGVPSQGQLRILRTGRCCEGSTCQFLYALFVVLMFPTTPMSV